MAASEGLSRVRRHGRREPYTEIGVRRLPCVRGCGRKATQQWQICADANLYRPICTECDIELNAMVLRWAGDPDAEMKIATYRERLLNPS